MAFDPLATPVDYVILGGKRTPGIATVVGVSQPRNWDVIKGYAYAGALLRGGGRDLAKFTIEIRLYTEQDHADWAAFAPVVARDPTFQRSALAIVHPWTAEAGISGVAIEDVLQPEEIDGGGFLRKIKCIEWRKPKLVLAKPEAAAAGPVDNDPVSQQIAALTKDLAAEMAK